jgi:hypothetical protein
VRSKRNTELASNVEKILTNFVSVRRQCRLIVSRRA